ncbi:MAG: Gldg family protein [Clostridia bacterium]|nr:Gldg family protein [Clostridia bacterium]
MKFNTPGSGRRFGRATRSVALTALVLVGVLLINVLFTLLASHGLWYIDLTTYSRNKTKYDASGNKITVKEDYELYTLTPGAVNLLDDTFAELNASRQNKGEENVKVELIFCDDPDNLMKNTSSRLIYMTALCLQKEFPDTIEVKTVNVKRDPSQVQKYKTTSYTTFYSTSVIVASGSEYRHLRIKSFFMEDTTTSELWAYSGEKRFLATIFEVTKAASPKCVLLSNHGESGYSDTFISLLEDAGYEVIRDFDLENQELPADCRLVVCVDPVKDFKGYNDIALGNATVSEIDKLDKFLDNENSMMVFFNADTPHLPTFEEYLEKWGISIIRQTDDAGDTQNALIKDPSTSLTADGKTVVGSYATAGGGASITSDMQSMSYPPKVAFRNATAFKYSPSYKRTFVEENTEEGTPAFSYGSYYSSTVYRQAFDVFNAGSGAAAYIGDTALEAGEYPYMLMTIASETETSAGDRNGYTTVSHDSYVVACASSEFLCDELLASNSYGNADMLAGTLRSLGKDSMAAIIDQYLKPFVETDVEDGRISQSQKTSYTVLLSVLPAVLLFGSGIFVMTRRKHS